MPISPVSLILSVLIVASSVAAFGLWGIAVAACLLAIAAYLRTAESAAQLAYRLLVILLIVLFAIFFTPCISAVVEAAFRASCKNNMYQLGRALLNYHARYQCFPPAYLADANGKPMHSWRVLILPFLEQEDLFKKYNLNEPWDGPNNRKLAAPRPFVYACPEVRNAWAPDWTFTSYVAVVGAQTAWPGAECASVSNMRNKGENTILLVELANSDIHWMEPRDLSFDEARGGTNPPAGQGIGTVHVRSNGFFYHDQPVFHAVFADGAVRCLPADTPPERLEALLTTAGGETHDLDTISPPQLRWDRIIALGVFGRVVWRAAVSAEGKTRETKRAEMHRRGRGGNEERLGRRRGLPPTAVKTPADRSRRAFESLITRQRHPAPTPRGRGG